jgi:hypothetical protein
MSMVMLTMGLKIHTRGTQSYPDPISCLSDMQKDEVLDPC